GRGSPGVSEDTVRIETSEENRFEPLAEKVRTAIDSAESIAFAEPTNLQQLQEAKRILLSQEPTLSTLSDIAEEKAKSGNVDYVDSISSLMEQYNSVKYGIEDQLDQLRPEGPKEPQLYEEEQATTEIPMEEDKFRALVEEVRHAIDTAESIAFAENIDPQQLRDAKRVLSSQEPSLSTLTTIAEEKAKSGDADYMDIIAPLMEQFTSVSYGINDQLDESGLQVR
ncbi:unnamed protein product, partial [Cylicostephanus goldi]